MNERDEVDRSSPMGIATFRFEERAICALGLGNNAPAKFEENNGVQYAGVLFLLPSLLIQGLLKAKEVYQFSKRSYYSLESIILTLAFMALLRIKNPEQLKQCKPGELGRVIGLDRIPEVKCLRKKLNQLTKQNQSVRLNNLLIDHWYSENKEDAGFLYIDGHNRIYYGIKAHLPAKYISRQKLCISATTEYWVNDAKGMPVMMVTGELTEKLEQAIENYIIPQLQATCLLPVISDQKEPVCVFVFDREAYHPDFFIRLWIKYRIAVITYRKNVKDCWETSLFTDQTVQVLEHAVTMQLCEMGTQLSSHWFREIRRLSDSGHQTSVVSTHPTLSMEIIAGRMFGRWCQENFFKYLIYDYDFDKMINFGVETIDPEREVPNPQYRKVNHELKKHREKIQRVKAKFYNLMQQVMDQEIDKISLTTTLQAKDLELLDELYKKEKELIDKRSHIKSRIKIKQMPEQVRYDKLKTESKVIMNIIKMICYRAETAVADMVAPFLSRAENEKRMFVKQVALQNADIIPNYSNKTLTIVLHTLSAPRYNKAAYHLAELLTQTEIIYPGTELRVIYKTTANTFCEK
jgi:hypothetical protein